MLLWRVPGHRRVYKEYKFARKPRDKTWPRRFGTLLKKLYNPNQDARILQNMKISVRRPSSCTESFHVSTPFPRPTESKPKKQPKNTNTSGIVSAGYLRFNGRGHSSSSDVRNQVKPNISITPNFFIINQRWDFNGVLCKLEFPNPNSPYEAQPTYFTFTPIWLGIRHRHVQCLQQFTAQPTQQ